MRYVVSTSGGKGSWYTGRRIASEMAPGDHLTLLFADTLTEDPDLYRFLDETAADVLAHLPDGCTGQLVKVAEGRDVWQVFHDSRFLGNTRIDPCSRVLKREITRAWIETNCDPADTCVCIGIDWTEAHRFTNAAKHWAPWQVRAPLCEEPFIERGEIDRALADTGIRQSRLYELGFKHNNCGGFCVKAGQAQFRLLLEKLPDRYAYHEAKEQELRAHLDKDVAILRDRRGGQTKPMTLQAFRERIEAAEAEARPFADDPVAMEDFNYEFGGCGCFTPDDYANKSEPGSVLP